MATYSAWLIAQANRGDTIGMIGAGWKSAQVRHRPKKSGVAGVNGWIAQFPDEVVPQLPAGQLGPWLERAAEQFTQLSAQSGSVPVRAPLIRSLDPGEVIQLPARAGHPAADGEDGMTEAQAEAVAAMDAQHEAEPARIDLTQPMDASPQVMEVLQAFEKRLGALSQIFAEQAHMRDVLVRLFDAVHSQGELLVAFIQAMAPVIELGADLARSDQELTAGEQATLDAEMERTRQAAQDITGQPRSLAAQLGWFEDDLSDRPPMPPETRTAFQQAARELAERNGWVPPATEREQDWAATGSPGQPYHVVGPFEVIGGGGSGGQPSDDPCRLTGNAAEDLARMAQALYAGRGQQAQPEQPDWTAAYNDAQPGAGEEA